VLNVLVRQPLKVFAGKKLHGDYDFDLVKLKDVVRCAPQSVQQIFLIHMLTLAISEVA
jgi:hypothetical protein